MLSLFTGKQHRMCSFSYGLTFFVERRITTLCKETNRAELLTEATVALMTGVLIGLNADKLEVWRIHGQIYT